MNRYYIDSHIHLDLFKELQPIVDYINTNKIYTIAVTNHPKVYEQFCTRINSQYIRLSLGMHPQLIDMVNMTLFKKYLSQTKYIGEVGLDFSDNFSSIQQKEKQIDVFEQIIRLSKNKAISIHSKKAEGYVLDCIEKYYDKSSFYILHWYTGSIKNLKRAIDLGCYFSINFDLASTKHFKEYIKNIPRDKILTETDLPFSTKGRLSNINILVRDLGKCYDLKDIQMMECIFSNFYNILYNIH